MLFLAVRLAGLHRLAGAVPSGDSAAQQQQQQQHMKPIKLEA
jgi:hypothetical protein